MYHSERVQSGMSVARMREYLATHYDDVSKKTLEMCSDRQVRLAYARTQLCPTGYHPEVISYRVRHTNSDECVFLSVAYKENRVQMC